MSPPSEARDGTTSHTKVVAKDGSSTAVPYVPHPTCLRYDPQVKVLIPCVFEFQRIGSTQTRGFESVVTIRTVGILPVVSTGCSDYNSGLWRTCMLQQKRNKKYPLHLKF